MALQDIAIVNISLEGPGVTRAGFGTPLFITNEKLFHERVKTYSKLPNASDSDALPTASEAYKALLAFLSQTPDPKLIKLGRSVQDTMVVLFDDTISNGDVVSLTVSTPKGVVTGTYTFVTADTNTEIAAGIASSIEAALIVAGYTAPEVGSGGTVFNITSSIGGLSVVEPSLNVSMGFPQPSSDNGVVSYTASDSAATAAEDLPAAEMNEITSVDNDFYFVTSSNKSLNYIVGDIVGSSGGMARYVESTEKLYFVSTEVTEGLAAEMNPVDAADIPHLLKDNNWFRSIHLWHDDSEAYPEANFIAHRAPFDPGSVTWSNLNIAGVGASRNVGTGKLLNQTELGNLSNKNSNFVQSIGSLPIFREGKSAAGEWIDNLRGRDWLTARLREDLTNLLVQQRGGKLPYTDSGIASVVSVMRTRLENAKDVGFLADYTINIPKAADVLVADKQARILKISFKGILAGAIHMVEITGELTV